MASKPTTDKEVIQAIGLDALTAHGYTEFAIKKWMQRGIAWRERPKVKRIAASKRVALPTDFLDEQRAA
jgi:hypothetical protein